MSTYFAWILAALGLALFIEGTPYFLFPAKMRAWLLTIASRVSDRQLRNVGLAAIILGLALVWLSLHLNS